MRGNLSRGLAKGPFEEGARSWKGFICWPREVLDRNVLPCNHAVFGPTVTAHFIVFVRLLLNRKL